MEISHTNCPAKLSNVEPDPVFVWDDFYMAGIAGYYCPLCMTHVYVKEDEKD